MQIISKYKKRIKYNLVLLTGMVLLSGCSIGVSNSNTNSGADGGMWKSGSQGETWSQKVLVPTASGKPKAIAGLNFNSLVMDPNDHYALYAGTQDNGLYYSYDAGENWQEAISIGKIDIKSIAIDPKAKCTIYVASKNKVFKSIDCSRTWSQIYFDTDLTVTVNSIVIDHYDSSTIYIGTSRGDIIKSSDRGGSWRATGRFDGRIQKIVIAPGDSRIIFAGTDKEGLNRSNDGGNTWEDLSKTLKEFKDSSSFKDLAISESKPGFIILASKYGLVKSSDYGDTWAKIELLTPEKDAIINAMAISPKNENEIYYVTNTTFYRSLDGGQNWATKKLPTSRAGGEIIVDPQDAKIIYLGTGAKK